LHDFREHSVSGVPLPPPTPGETQEFKELKETHSPASLYGQLNERKTRDERRSNQASCVQGQTAGPASQGVGLAAALAAYRAHSFGDSKVAGQPVINPLSPVASDSSPTTASKGSPRDDSNCIYLSPPSNLVAPNASKDSTSYPLELLTSFLTSGMYRVWYPSGTSTDDLSDSDGRATTGMHLRGASMMSQDQHQFATYIRNLLSLMRPPSVAIERAVEYARKLRNKVSTTESTAFGSHYAVAAVSLFLATKILDGELCGRLARSCNGHFLTRTVFFRYATFNQELGICVGDTGKGIEKDGIGICRHD
jgi:hypothetical protein